MLQVFHSLMSYGQFAAGRGARPLPSPLETEREHGTTVLDPAERSWGHPTETFLCPRLSNSRISEWCAGAKTRGRAGSSSRTGAFHKQVQGLLRHFLGITVLPAVSLRFPNDRTLMCLH